MPDHADTPTPRSALAALPSVNELVASLESRGLVSRLGRRVVTDAARAEINEARNSLRAGSNGASAPTTEALATRAAERLELSDAAGLQRVINATGIIIHTGLGRAPLAESVVDALVEVARGYAPVELDMPTGARGKRSRVIAPLLCELTGAEAATAVNNNAAAMTLIFSALASDRDVVVSRGELVEIGGSYRLPEVIEAGGSRLREVGTTNKTRIGDYERAISDDTGALLKVHPSNFRIEGFTAEASIEELAALGRSRDVPVIHDTGSGLLTRKQGHALGLPDPAARASIEAGADLVVFSGDKLLSGPQAGIIVGRADLVERIERHPLMRAMRLDKLILGALNATLRLHRDDALARRELPVFRCLAAPVDSLIDRAQRLAEVVGGLDGITAARAIETAAYIGGGSVPGHEVPSGALAIDAAGGAGELSDSLRAGTPGVVGRVHHGELLLDLRTVDPSDDAALLDAIRSAL